MKALKRIVSLFLALIMSIGILSTPAFAANGKMTVYMIDLPRGSDPNKSGWGHPALSFMGGWDTPARQNLYSVMCIDGYNGQVAYCIEPGIGLQTGDSYSGHGEDYWDNYPSNLNPTISPTVIKAYIGRIMQYGWSGTGNLNWSSANPAHAEDLSRMIATQLLIWETIVGERDSQFYHVDANSQGKDNITDQIADNHPLRNQIFDDYAVIENQVRQHTMLPSFFSRSAGTAESHELKWNGYEYAVTLVDTNNVLKNYRFSSAAAGLQFSVNGNELTISCDTAPEGPVTITAEKTNGQRRGVVVCSLAFFCIGAATAVLAGIVLFLPAVLVPFHWFSVCKVELPPVWTD